MTQHEAHEEDAALPAFPKEVAGQADWTPSSVIEREADYRRRQVAKHDRAALTVGALAISLAAVGGIWGIILLGSPIAACTLIPLLLIGLSYTARAIDGRRARLEAEAKATDLILQDEFGASEGWLVDLRILQGAAPTGDDRGMLWFEGGRMIFAGHRTSFALSTDQVRGKLEAEYRIPGLRHSCLLNLDLVTEAGQVTVSIEPEAGTSGAFQAAVAYWRSLAPHPSMPRLGGQFPPTTIGPGAVSTRRLAAKAIASVAYWVFLLWFALRIYDGIFWILICGSLIGYCLGFWFPIHRWRAWQDRRRMRK